MSNPFDPNYRYFKVGDWVYNKETKKVGVVTQAESRHFYHVMYNRNRNETSTWFEYLILLGDNEEEAFTEMLCLEKNHLK